jgi:hypothetical protein
VAGAGADPAKARGRESKRHPSSDSDSARRAERTLVSSVLVDRYSSDSDRYLLVLFYLKLYVVLLFVRA